MDKVGVTLGGWTLTGVTLGLDGLVDFTIEKDGVTENFEKCLFGPGVEPMPWAVEQAERRAATRQGVDNGADG